MSLIVYFVLCVPLYIWVKMYVNIHSIHVDEVCGICMCGNLHGRLYLCMVDPVNTDEALVTEYRRDNLDTSHGGNAIDSHVFTGSSLMPRKWQPHHQDRAGRLTPCLFQNLIVFRSSMRKKSWTIC